MLFLRQRSERKGSHSESQAVAKNEQVRPATDAKAAEPAGTAAKPVEAGKSTEGESELRLAASPSLAAVKKGQKIILPLADGGTLSGRVNLVQVSPDGTVRLGGTLIGGRTGSFSLGQDKDGLMGRVLLPQEGLAYLVSVASSGQIQARPMSLSQVVCYPLPRDSGFDPQSALPGEGPQATPPELRSRPGAAAVLYLDFDGAVVTDPDWNEGNTITAAASTLNASQITAVWNQVKEDFWPLDINVTTAESDYTNAAVGRRMRVIITPSYSWYGPVGGVAYVDSFSRGGSYGFNPDVPAWVFNSSVNGIAEAISHELGHTLGLRHDGRTSPTEEYYAGHGSGAVSWGPIMGAAYGVGLSQWSKGEYANANNQEDDLAIISGAQATPLSGAVNQTGYIADEAGNSRGTAASLSLSGGNIQQFGIISSAADVDFYVFSVASATTLSLTVNPASPAPNLDALIELQDASGNVQAQANPDLQTYASLSASLTAGTYYLMVRGAGRGSVTGDGYSDYGSVGYYSLTGTFSAAPVAPTIASDPASLTVNNEATANFSVGVNGTTPFSYVWRKNGVNLANGGRISGANTATLTIATVDPTDAASYDVVVTNVVGSATSGVATLVVNLPPQFTTRPLSKVAVVGQAVVFSAVVTGEGVLSYEWKRNGQVIAGATGPTLNLANVSLADRGSYQLTVTGATGTSRSFFALNVAIPNGAVVAWGDNQYGQSTVPVGLGNVAANAAEWHNLTLRTDGTVTAWGGGPYASALSVPSGLSDVVQLAAGNGFSLALKADGTVVAWGDNYAGRTTVPAGLANVVSIAAGNSFGVALKADGTVVAWGDSSNGYTSVPSDLRNVMAIAAGDEHTLAVKSDGTVVAWGYFGAGAVTVPAGLSNVVAVAGGSGLSLALKADGTVVGWGGSQAATIPAGLSGVTKIAAGQSHGLALKSDGSVMSWGFNGNGQTTVPVSAANVADIEAGNLHSLAIVPGALPAITIQPANKIATLGDTVSFSVGVSGLGPFAYRWQKNGVDLSNGTRISGTTTATLSITDAQAGDAGDYSVVVSNTAGSVTSNTATLTVVAPPVIVSRPLTRIVASGQPAVFTVSASGSGHTYEWRHQGEIIAGQSGPTMAIPHVSPADRGVYWVEVTNAAGGKTRSYFFLNVAVPNVGVSAWGYNGQGRTTVPAGLSDVVGISAAAHSLALKSDGSVVAWGYNGNGELSIPAGLGNVVAVAAGGGYSLALKADGNVAAWGFNASGQANVPVGLSDVIAISASHGNHCLALKADGTVVAWGANDYGKATVPSGLRDVVGISAGAMHSLAVKADGTVVAWGNNNDGQTDVPAALSGVKAVAGGWEYSLALKTDGTVVSWGRGFYGETTTGGLTSIVDLAAATDLSLFIRANGTMVALGRNLEGQTNIPAGLGAVVAVANGGMHVLALAGVAAPFISAHPSDQTVAAGQTATLSVSATGDGLTYQWRRNGVNLANGGRISGASSSTLVITGVEAGDAGSYDVVVVNSLGGSVTSNTATLTVNQLSQTISFGTLADRAYTTVPFTLAAAASSGLPVSFSILSGPATLSGSDLTITGVGTVTVRATQGGNATYAAATNVDRSFNVTKAAATVTLGSLTSTYDGTAKSATATTNPAGLNVTFTYDGSATPPANAGSYAVVGTIAEANYQGTASGTLVIAKAAATVTLGSLTATYDGTAKGATATTSPAGLNVTFTYDGSATAPTGAGSYAVVGTITEANYQGTASGTLVIAKATATVTLGNLAATYNGAAKSATATTNPANLTVAFTYNGSATAPTNAGSYAVVGTIAEANYQGTASGTLVIAKAVATVTLGNLTPTYDGTAKSATATTTPAGLTVNLSYDGSPTAPTNAGSYAVVGTISDSNHQGSASGTLVIAKAVATVTLGNLTPTYDGTAKSATVTTTPAGLTVNLSYDGSLTAPTNAGSYAVVGSVNEANYQGTANGTLVIAKADQTIAFTGPANQPYSATPITLSATASSGLAVTFAVVSGPATVAGDLLTLTGAGAVTVRATQGGDANRNAAPAIDQTFTVTANFASWLLAKFTAEERADANISGPNADPDHDGFANLLEYALGLEPKSASTAGLPQVGIEGSDWAYTYNRPADRTDVTYVVEMSTNLSSWGSAGVSHSLVSTAGGTETWRAKYPLASAANVFFRLRVTGQ